MYSFFLILFAKLHLEATGVLRRLISRAYGKLRHSTNLDIINALTQTGGTETFCLGIKAGLKRNKTGSVLNCANNMQNANIILEFANYS